MDPAKRSLTPTLTPEDQPLLKRSRSDSFNEPDRIAKEVHDTVQKIFPKVLEIFCAVRRIPVAKWSSLDAYAAERMQFAQQAFACVIRNRCPDYNFQIPDLGTRKEEEPVSSNASQGTVDPSPPEKQEKLIRAINKLFLYLNDCRAALENQELENAVQEVRKYDNFVCRHYKEKVPELNDLKVPKYSPDEDLLVACPHRSCNLIEKIEAMPISARADIQSSLKEFLELAQKIHNHFQEALGSWASCKQRLEDWCRLQIILRRQLLDAKEKRLYRDEAHALRQLEKMGADCRQQQEESMRKRLSFWEEVKMYGEPPLYCSPAKLCGLPFAMHALKGSRNNPAKIDIEDRVLAIPMEIAIESQKMTLPLFAIMDGHGGDQTAQFCKEKLAAIFAAQIAKYNDRGITRAGLMNAAKTSCLLLQNDSPELSGTTLLFATVVNGLLCVFSVGDSRAWLLGDGLQALTFDAAASEAKWQEKVQLRGGSVFQDKFGTYRVQGTLKLSLTASIGDKLDARQLVHVPKDRIIPLTDHPAAAPLYLILASDGLSSVASDAQLLDFFNELVEKGLPMEAIVSHFLHRAQAAWAAIDKKRKNNEFKTGDDVSVILVRLR